MTGTSTFLASPRGPAVPRDHKPSVPRLFADTMKRSQVRGKRPWRSISTRISVLARFLLYLLLLLFIASSPPPPPPNLPPPPGSNSPSTGLCLEKVRISGGGTGSAPAAVAVAPGSNLNTKNVNKWHWVRKHAIVVPKTVVAFFDFGLFSTFRRRRTLRTGQLTG